MAKRFTDTEIWKKQRWFRKLSPVNKLAFFYIKDQCNHAGIWKIDCSDLIDDIGLKDFNLDEFINEMNLDFDKINGSKIHKERVKKVKDNNLWITGFLQFQYESKEKLVSINPCVKTALQILNGLDVYKEGLNKGYITLKEKIITHDNTLETAKDKDNIIHNNKINKESEILFSNGTWEDEKKYFLADEQWQMKICADKSLKKDQLIFKIDEFLKMIELKEDYKSSKELKSHFVNWYNKNQLQSTQPKFPKIKFNT
jgi:hypothetical protein